MEPRPHCVYNQTSECFLSLEVMDGEDNLATAKAALASHGDDEGDWLVGASQFQTVEIATPRDLLYVDRHHKVVRAVEALPGVQLEQLPAEAVSLLVLPPRTIVSSQTQAGHQLLICAAEEMESRLSSMTDDDRTGQDTDSQQRHDQNAWPPVSVSEDRRGASRKRWPRLVAMNASGPSVPVYGIRDISAKGLYLLTTERWPLGREVRMFLQRTDDLADSSVQPIMVEMRVSRWGSDGLGLEFMRADAEVAALLAMQVH